MIQPDARPRRGRPRHPDADKSILDAALEEYAERGWDSFTIDGVSKRSGFGKSAIYLRWSNKTALLTESLNARTSTLEHVDTGSLVSDLEELARRLLRHYLDPLGWATLRLMIESTGQSGPRGHFDSAIVHPHVDAASNIVDRAVVRGEIAADPPTGTLIECLYGGVTMSAMTIPADHRDLSDAEVCDRVRPIVALLLAGVGAASAE